MTVNSVAAVSPNPRNATVSSVNVTFSLPINVNSLTSLAVTLTDNGNPVAVSGVSLALVSGTTTTYQLSGLDAFTAAEGSYTATINASGLQDTFGNLGIGSISTSWLMDTTAPTSTVNSLPSATNSTSLTVSVAGSDPTGSNGSAASGVQSFTIFESEDNGPFTALATVTPANPSTPFTGQIGHTYGFYSVATDNAGNVQPTPTRRRPPSRSSRDSQSPRSLPSPPTRATQPSPRWTSHSANRFTLALWIRLI